MRYKKMPKIKRQLYPHNERTEATKIDSSRQCADSSFYHKYTIDIKKPLESLTTIGIAKREPKYIFLDKKHVEYR